MPELNKIIFLFTPGPIGGAEKVVAGGIKALKSLGMDVELWIIKEERVPHVTEAFLELIKQEGIEARLFSSRKVFDLTLLLILNKAFKASGASIVHAHGFKAAFYGRLATTKNLIITHHGKTGHTLKVKIYEFLELVMMKRANAVVAVSDDMKRMLIDSGVRSQQVHLVENFMTVRALERLPSQSSPLKLIFVGRLSPEKGCESLILALKNLNDPSISLTILGDGVERARLTTLVEASGLKDQIQFLGFRNDVALQMAAADALVMPSFREGQPLTLIEACMMGLPVLASKVGGIPELVHPGRNGLLFSPGNIEQIAECIRNFKTQQPHLSQEADKLKVQFKTRFAPETWAMNTKSIYQKVLSQR